MTPEPTPDQLAHLDDQARAAAHGLRAHVHAELDIEQALAELPTSRPWQRWSRVAAVAAVVALLVAAVAALGQDDDGTRLDTDQALPGVEQGVLRPLGPHDGKDSVQLPVTATPSTGLHDGDVVTVTGEGFVPGETVGLVQCAREAGGETPETRGGVDGCYTTDYKSITVDDNGVATGSYSVHRVLTTPLTGSVDCAGEAERCMVAMGALDDYDRSGGARLTFAEGLPAVSLPTVSVTPTDGLADGDLVHVVADGLAPDTLVSLTVCSSDPSACWPTGEDVADPTAIEEGGIGATLGLAVDSSGRAEGDVAAWRYLPGGEPGTYIDCAVSRCALRLFGDVVPPTVPLHFTQGGDGPTAPSLGATPTTGLAPGDRISVEGAGFAPGGEVALSFCAAQPDADMGWSTCMSAEHASVTADDDGTFAVTVEVPHMGEVPSDLGMACSPDGTCDPADLPRSDEPIRCDGVTTSCSLVAELYVPPPREGNEIPVWSPPRFPPPPVPITFR